MRCWLGDLFEWDETYQEEVEWAKGHNPAMLLAEFQRLRAEEISKGSGPFLHTDPYNRPSSIFGGTTTTYTGGEKD